MRTIVINIKNEFTVYSNDDYHVVEDIISDMIDQLINQGMDEVSIRDGIEFAMDNFFQGEE